MTSSRPDPGSPEARLALLDELRNAERRAAISRVASIIGHLIGTPLQVISGRTWLIRSNLTPEATLENARRIEEQVERLAQRVQQLIQYLTTPEADQDEPVTVQELLSQALALYSPIAASRGLHIVLHSSLPAPGSAEVGHRLPGTSTLILLTSLLSLAIRLAPAGVCIELEASASSENHVILALRIPGMAVPKTRIDRLEPPEQQESLTADDLQVLSVCHAIARRIGGKFEVVPVDASRATIQFECAAIP
ncbi:MAG TPA: hypothetical protein VFQ61_05560 [Polyangiaceae bacterium]|nr:hypothetical protein [Polyangiaceae bacterium]